MLNHARAFILYPLAERYLQRDIRSKLIQLRTFSNESPKQRQSRQQKELHSLVQSAALHVPYYRELFEKIGFQPERLLKSTDFLQEIPLLTKEILREQGDRLLDERIPKKDLHIRETNGSTGLTTTIWYDQEALDWTAAANLLASELTGCPLNKRHALLSSKFFDKRSAKEAFRDKVKCWSLNRTNVQTHAFDDAGLQDLIDHLKRANAFSVQGHPSTAYFLAVYGQKSNQDLRGLFKVYQSTGESLEREKLKIIESTFDCRVFNRYGNAEFGVVAQSDGNFDDLKVLESIVIPESHSLGNGLEEIVLTGLKNTAMPLIRYKTGDVGQVQKLNGKTSISRLTGRVHDVIELNGQPYPTHFIKDVLERIGGLDEFQLIQSKSSNLTTLKLIPNRNFDQARVEQRIEELFGQALRIETTSFDGLVMQGWRDKFRYLVKR